ncbi:MAG: hypothetical protein J3Q66DRAFT_328542 [Benniella sp.]|nr:MAG: hypothetical protein J3Q66DRAFT_328542 [Benniella sp.]
MLPVRRTVSVLLRSRCPVQVASYSTRSSGAAFLNRLDFLAPAQQQPQQHSQPPFQRNTDPWQNPPPLPSITEREFPTKGSSTSSPLKGDDISDLESSPLLDSSDAIDRVKRPPKRAFNKNRDAGGDNLSHINGRTDGDADDDSDNDTTGPRSIIPDRARRDEEINAQWIQYISNEGNMGVKRLSVVLQSIDRSQYFLVEVNSRTNPPICKLVSKKELYQKAKAEKHAKKANELSKKELQLNWATDPHDLDHKLAKFKSFLEKGYRVEIQINGKKGRNTTQQERDAVFEKVKAEFEPVAKYVKQPEWIKPTTVAMIFHGSNKVKKQQ